MAGATARNLGRPLLVALVLSVTAPALVASAPAAAAEAFPLRGDTFGIVTADLNGDGSREIVRVTATDVAERYLVEGWRDDGRAWSSLGSVPLTRRNAADDADLPAGASEAGVAILVWNDGPRQRVVVATGGPSTLRDEDRFGGACCLTLTEVGVGAGRLELTPHAGAFGEVEQMVVLDVDADGTDELLLIAPTDAGARHARLLRWSGERFDAEDIELPLETGGGFNLIHGETNGLPGEEVIFGPAESGTYVRLGVGPDGSLEVETASLDLSGGFGWLLGAAGGSLIAVSREMRVMEWPRGGSPSTTHSTDGIELPNMNMMANGNEAVLVDFGSSGFASSTLTDVTVFDLALEPVLTFAPGEAVARLWELPQRSFPAFRNLSHNIYPYVGPLPGGMYDGRAAYFAHGTLITLDPSGELDTIPVSSMVGMAPVGIAGIDGSWMALAQDYYASPDVAYFFPAGGPLASVVLMPTSEVIAPESDAGRLATVLRGASVVSAADGTELLLTAPSGFEATFDAPAGSLVLAVVDQSVVHDGKLDGGPLTLQLAPRRERAGNQPFDAAVIVLTPAGHGYSISWQAEILREPPDLAASASTETFALRSAISGRVSAGSTVMVDGRPASLTRSGAFYVAVDAPAWPHDIVVVARDPFGNETVTRLQVIGFLDYRGLPWAAIAAMATFAFGAVLFMRTPRRRGESSGPMSDAVLEEIDAD